MAYSNLMTVIGFTVFALTASLPAAAQDKADGALSENSQTLATKLMEELQADKATQRVEFFETVTPLHGSVKLPEAKAKLDIPDGFYFLAKKDARHVLEDIWGNPPQEYILGMIFPDQYIPTDEDSWAAVVSYDATGHISDEDALSINYGDLLREMKSDTKAGSVERVKLGYESIELVGWASPPRYDAVNHRLHWAKELKFGDMERSTLNYNFRFLNRRGVLEFNYIADIDALPEIEAALPEMAKIAVFQTGEAYTDFNPNTDKVAAYGVAGLIAGGAAAKKLGLFAVLLLFLKKGWVFILLGLGVLGKFFKGFGRNKPPTV